MPIHPPPSRRHPRSFIEWTGFEAFLHEEFLQSIIPRPRGLLEAIEGLIEFEDIVRMLWTFKTWGVEQHILLPQAYH